MSEAAAVDTYLKTVYQSDYGIECEVGQSVPRVLCFVVDSIYAIRERSNWDVTEIRDATYHHSHLHMRKERKQKTQNKQPLVKSLRLPFHVHGTHDKGESRSCSTAQSSPLR